MAAPRAAERLALVCASPRGIVCPLVASQQAGEAAPKPTSVIFLETGSDVEELYNFSNLKEGVPMKRALLGEARVFV